MTKYTPRGIIPLEANILPLPLSKGILPTWANFTPTGQMRLHDEFTPRGKFAPRGKLMHINGVLQCCRSILRTSYCAGHNFNTDK